MVKKFNLGMPDFVTIRTEEKELVTTFENGQAALEDVVVRIETTEEQVNAFVKADTSPVTHVKHAHYWAPSTFQQSYIL